MFHKSVSEIAQSPSATDINKHKDKRESESRHKTNFLFFERRQNNYTRSSYKLIQLKESKEMTILSIQLAHRFSSFQA